jgi:ATP-binding cassette subfamily F protein 3
MLVSHDRALLRAVCDEFWLVGRGGVEPFEGDLDDYQRFLLDEAKRLREALKTESLSAAEKTGANTSISERAGWQKGSNFSASPDATRRNPAEQRKLDAERRQRLAAATRPWRKELEAIDARMPAIATQQATLEDALTRPMSPADMATAGKTLKALADELEALELRWLELQELIEQAEQAEVQPK